MGSLQPRDVEQQQHKRHQDSPVEGLVGPSESARQLGVAGPAIGSKKSPQRESREDELGQEQDARSRLDVGARRPVHGGHRVHPGRHRRPRIQIRITMRSISAGFTTGEEGSLREQRAPSLAGAAGRGRPLSLSTVRGGGYFKAALGGGKVV